MFSLDILNVLYAPVGVQALMPMLYSSRWQSQNSVCLAGVLLNLLIKSMYSDNLQDSLLWSLEVGLPGDISLGTVQVSECSF